MNGLFRALLRLYPRGFRARFGDEIVESALRDVQRARLEGRIPLAVTGLGSVLDLVKGAVAERWRPSWYEPGREGNRSSMGRWMMMTGWLRDLRHATGSLRRAPGFAVVSVVTLGVAMGVNAGIFSVVDTVLLDPLPYGDVDRLVHIAATAPGSELPNEFGVSAEFYVDYKAESRLLEDLSTFTSFTASLRVGDRVERIRMAAGTPSLFSTLGATPLLGRLPTAEDEGGTAVISHALWTTWFGGDDAVLGRVYPMADRPREIVGVMPPAFRFPNDGVLVWMAEEIRAEGGITPGRFGMNLVGRMAPNVTYDALVEELGAIAARLPERYGGSANYARLMERHRPVVRSFEELLLGPVSGSLWVLMGAVATVLLIACANVANLFTVRGEGRARDAAVRRALGASRGRLVRALMAEAVVVAFAAAVLAVGLAWLTVPVLVGAAPAEVPRLGDVGLSSSTLLFTGALAAVVAVACGLGPALRLSGVGTDRLRDGSRGATARRHWARDALVIGQTALALLLLIGSGLLVRSFQALRSVDPGYDLQDIFTFQIAPEEEHLTDGPTFARFHLDFMDRLRALPQVESVGIVENVPLNEAVSSVRFVTEESAPQDDAGTLLGLTFSAGDYYRTMGIELLEGRAFEERDHVEWTASIVVSASAAELLFPGESAAGRRVRQPGGETWLTVVGVVEDVKQLDFRDEGAAVAYLPMVGPTPTSWVLSSPAYVVKTPRAETIAPEIREIVREIAPSAPMYRMFTMEGLAADSMARLTFTTLTLGTATALALLLGVLGLYGVLSYVVAERTREIGVRMALGAEARRVRGMVVRQGARVVGLGVLLGAGAALAVTRVLSTLLFGVAPADAVTFVAMSLTMAAVGLMAVYVPAHRASAVDPVLSLRE